LATEILTSPSTYLTLGLAPLLGGAAKTAAGRAASKAGLLTDDLGLLAREASKRSKSQIGRNQLLRQSPAELIDLMPANLRDDALRRFREKAGSQADDLLGQSMTASNRVSVPFVGEWGVDFYTKAGGDKLAQWADNIGDFAQNSRLTGSAVRGAQALFDPKFMGYTDDEGRWFARTLTQETRYADQASAAEVSRAVVDAARNVGEDTFRSQGFQDALRNVLEGQMSQLSPEMAAHFDRGGGARGLVMAVRKQQRIARENARLLGIPLNSARLPNNVQYFLRQRVSPDNPTFASAASARQARGYASDPRVASVLGEGRGRRGYTRAFPAWVLNKMARDGKLQDKLRRVADLDDIEDSQKVLQKWLADNAKEFSDPFAYARPPDSGDVVDFATEAMEEAGKESDLWKGLADSLRNLPQEFAGQGLPMFGSSVNDIARYARSRGRAEATANVILNRLLGKDTLVRQAADTVAGDEVYGLEEALKLLGFDTAIPKRKDGTLGVSRASQAVASRLGVSPTDLANLSVPKQVVNQMRDRILGARVPREATGLLRQADKFTSAFKSLALLWPSRYTRDLYSGGFASATKNAFGFGDAARGFQIGRGEYRPILDAVRNLPDYAALNDPKKLNALRQIDRFKGISDQEALDELMIRKFLADAGAVDLGGTSVVDDLGRQADNLTMRTSIPGLSGGYTQGLRQKLDPTKRAFYWPFSPRSRSGNPNWLVDAGDRAAQATDSTNRIGAYLNRIRKGDDPRQAKYISDLTQVNYGNEAFTEFEREFLKRLIPFYSYTKGISPLVADQLLNKPAGLMGQSIRAVNRAGEPTEDRFTPEYLRQSAAIPIDSALPFLGVDTPGITRFLTNIDLPHEGLLNLFTPGVSNSIVGSVGDSIMKTGQNIMGQSNPLIKGPLEYILNRQFYSGRQLSDLYSMLEHDFGSLGRTVEQIGVNAPGGSRLLGAIRQLRDDRISLPERLTKFGFNALTGLKLQDVDQDRVQRLAARTTLNELLDQATGMASYENLYIKPEDLVKLSPQEQKQYLLYRALQAEAARKSRERKKAEQDPLAVFNL
jgi:hypothetical protein